jgi:hypothetical protein
MDRANYPYSIGLSISGKAGMNAASVPQGVQNTPHFLEGVDVAALGYIPFTDDSRIGLILEVGYSNTPFGLKLYETKEKSYINQKCISISPLFLLEGFTIGFDIGVAQLDTWVDDNKMFGVNNMPEDDFRMNLRLGGMIPLNTTKVGTLNLCINATYAIVGSEYNNGTYNPVTMAFGFNYIFNLEGK